VPCRLLPLDPAALIRIRELLGADEDIAGAQSLAALRERDRATGRDLQELAQNPQAQIMAWYRIRAGQHASVNNTGNTPGNAQGNVQGNALGNAQRDEQSNVISNTPGDATDGWVVLACMLLGAVAGAITAFGTFFYDGGQRVNMLLVLALFCALPLVSIAAFAIAALSRDGLAAINSGQLGAIIARVAPGTNLTKLAGLAAGDAGPTVSKWLLLGWSQWLGLGYGAGALCVAMALVLFTDLAFGWSTTVELSTQTLLSIVRGVAAPWQLWLPQAAPDEALISASRYFRLSTNAATNVDPLLLARWWPFALMTMLMYSVLPRLVTLAISQRRLRATCAHALLSDARVLRLLQRMNTPLVRTEALQTEPPHSSASGAQLFADLPKADDWQLINWAAVPVQQSALTALLGDSRQGSTLREAHAVGGARSSSQDAELVTQLAAHCALNDASAVLIIAKSWEPPTLDFIDFVSALRSALPAGAVVAIMPVAVVDGAPAPASDTHQQSWQYALDQAQLPNVHAAILREKDL
jgi:hypothetical protein